MSKLDIHGFYGWNQKSVQFFITYVNIGSIHDKSEIYLDKIIKAIPLSESLKRLEWYQIYKNRTPEEQDNLFNSLLTTQEKLIKQAYTNLSIVGRDDFLDYFKNINASLKIDPLFIIFLAGLPFSEFLYEASQEEIHSLLQAFMKTLDKLTITDDYNADEFSSRTSYYIKIMRNQLLTYIGKSSYTKKENFIPLPSDEVEFQFVAYYYSYIFIHYMII